MWWCYTSQFPLGIILNKKGEGAAVFLPSLFNCISSTILPCNIFFFVGLLDMKYTYLVKAVVNIFLVLDSSDTRQTN